MQTLQKTKSNGEQLAWLRSPGLLWWRAQLRRRNEAIQSVTEPRALSEKVGLLGLLAAFCVLLWQGGQSADLLNLFKVFSTPALSRCKNCGLPHPGASAWMVVLGVAGLSTLALFASFAILLLRDEG